MNRLSKLVLLALVGPAVAPALVLAQAYPVKPLRLAIGFTAGSGPDIVARLVSTEMSQSMGQPVVADNRVGAGGRIAADFVAKQPADGYTFLLGTASMLMVSPHFIKDMPYDTFRDFTPIAMGVIPGTAAVVTTALPVRSMADLVRYAKANPGKLNYGTNGIGSSHHLVGELINMAAGIDMQHVPFKGSNEVQSAVLANQVQLIFTSPANVRQYADKARPIALLASKRDPAQPDLPTMSEALPGYEPITDWFSFLGPANLPRPILGRLNAEVNKGLNAPESKAKLDNLNYYVVGGSSEDFSALMKREYPLFAKAVKAAKIPMQ
jgi:tripartite-type tricarboxylate transporter receptor subunit TctC